MNTKRMMRATTVKWRCGLSAGKTVAALCPRISSQMSGKREEETKLLVLAIGPPGSGKSSRLKCLCQRFGVDAKDVYHSSVDNIVEADKKYQNDVREVIKDVGGKKAAEKLVTNSSCWKKRRALIENMARVYIEHRDALDAYSKEADTCICNMKDGTRMVVVEVTGHQIVVDWVCSPYDAVMKESIRCGYKLVVFYPYVSPKTIWQRNVSRFVHNLHAPGGSPRIPSKDFVEQRVVDAQKTIAAMIGRRGCVDYLFVVDNNSENMDVCTVMLDADLKARELLVRRGTNKLRKSIREALNLRFPKEAPK